MDVIYGVSAEFVPGKNYCLLGPNGCGKTTLLRAMAGIIPAKGEILVDGRPISGMRRREIAKKIAVMSQITTLYFPYSVYETVLLGRYQHMRRSLFGQVGTRDRERSSGAVSIGLDFGRSGTGRSTGSRGGSASGYSSRRRLHRSPT